MKKLLFIILTLFSLQSFGQNPVYVKVQGIPGVYSIALNQTGDSLTWYVQGVRHAVLLGGVVDLSNYYDTASVNGLLSKKVDTSYHQSLVGINPIYFEVINPDSANIKFKSDSVVAQISYAGTARDSSNYKDSTLITKEYLNARLSAFSPGGVGISQLGTPAYGLTKLNDSTYIADTSVLASQTRLHNDSLTLASAINLKLNISDTANMLSPYARSNALALKLNISDTASILSPYLRKSDTTGKWVSPAVANATYATISNLNLKANDNAVVHNAGAETIGGIKTYTSPIVVSDPNFPVTLGNGYMLITNKLVSGGWARQFAKLTDSTNASIVEFGGLGTAQTVSYGYIGVGAGAAYNNNNIRFYADKTVGLMTVNDAVGDFVTRNAGTGLVTRRTASETLADIGALPVLAPYIAKSTSYTAVTADRTIEVTATGTTQTLPTAVGITGKGYIIKLTASGSATVATTSSQTIDGSATYSLTAQYKYVFVQSNGTNWIIIGNN